MKNILINTLLILFMSSALASNEVKDDLSDGSSGKMFFFSESSLTRVQLGLPNHWRHFETGGNRQKIRGELKLPKNSNKVPTVIFAHGCGGWKSNDIPFVEDFLRWGYAVFIVDSFRDRGIDEVCSAPALLNPVQRVPDFYGALRLLATHPNLDKDKIYLLGWSHGASAALDSATKWAEKEFAQKLKLSFKGVFSIYPFCNIEYPERFETTVPVRIHIGELDDATPAKSCQTLVSKLTEKDYNAKITVYKEAYHAFDWIGPAYYSRPSLVNSANCTIKEKSILGPVNAVTPSNCQTTGGTYGYNRKAKEQATKNLKTELEELTKK